ncbi:ATP-binding protein [Streptantibioticus parmotrematis]|uniref:ATP-binding protein n=1 Tax=Streptantibioticus parmotrematis TaxID=2873249 RepID=UPI003F4D3023
MPEGAGAEEVLAGDARPAGAGAEARPAVVELRLSAFKSHRGAVFPLGPVTLVTGGAGSGKSSVLEALAVLAALACGEELSAAVARTVRGGAAACVPSGSPPDAQGRRGFRVGCVVDGPAGPVRLDLAVQTEPELRVVGERLTASGKVLLTTALRDPARRTVQAAWHTAGHVPVTRAPLPDDRLATALLPLRVAGTTDGQRMVLSAAEQVLIALRAVFPVEPRPWRMREAARVGDTLLRGCCENLSAVLDRTKGECRTRHAMLVEAARAACGGPVEGLVVTRQAVRDAAGARGDGVLAALDRGALGLTPLDRLGDSELRFLALALVLLTGPGVLEMDQAAEVLPALRAMAVVADGLDAGLDRAQTRELLSLARRAAAHGHVRLLGTAHEVDPRDVRGTGERAREAGVTVLRLGRERGGS